MKVYLDTNVLLDFLDAQRPRHVDAVALIRYLIERDYQVVLSEDMLTTIYYIAKDKPRVLAFFQVMLEDWSIVSFGEAVIRAAIEHCQQAITAIDFEDVLQCLIAQAHRCDCLITNDAGFYRCGIAVYDSSSFLKQFNT